MEIVSGRTLDPLLTAIGMGPPRSQVDKNGENGWDKSHGLDVELPIYKIKLKTVNNTTLESHL